MATAGCSVGLEDLPLPAPGVSGDSYTIGATFENALNLPTKAKVKLAGADVGEVESMRVENYTAVVSLRIMNGVVLLDGTTAELRSATPLGDVFVSLQPPADPAPDAAVLDEGDSIPLESTSAAATVEELLATSSLLVNGGVVRNLTKLVNGLGSAVDGKGDRIAELMNESTRLVGDLNARSGEIQRSLEQTNGLVATLADQRSTISDAVAAAGPALGVLSENTTQVIDLVAQVAAITNQISKFPSVQGTDTRSMIADINTVSAELNRAATLPGVSLDTVNRILAPVIKVTNGTSAHTDADLQQLALGALPVPGHAGDPGSKLPDGTDWAAFVGTLTYTMFRLQGKFGGGAAMTERGRQRSVVETPARALVSGARYASAHRLVLSVIALALTLVLGVAYLVFGVFHLNPADRKIHIRVNLAESGGLLPDRNVTLRGVPVGRVTEVTLTDGGVVAVAAIDSSTQIPVGGEVRVAGLSLAGEQYLDFRPDSDSGPFLTDGAEIAIDDTSTPVPLSALMGNLDGMLAQIDPDTVRTIVDELGMSDQGPGKLTDIVDGGTFLISTLDSVLPQTVGVLNTSKIVLGTLSDSAAGLASTSRNLSTVLAGVESKDAGFRQLIDGAPATMQSVDTLFADNSPTMVQLLGNLATTAQMAYLRVPALHEFFFPATRGGSTLDALGTAFHDGGVWAFVNIYPRYSCDYDLPRQSPALPNFPEPFLHTYCANPDPSTLVRGARNAPRPPGEDVGYAPPAGADPLAQSDPTPIGPLSLPLEPGGPDLDDPRVR
ncbi:MAG: MlaD family protein [Rhodococcus sp. (in: high G+C Gram-positive bacteria)]|uniref:MlaD family protein n=1 Tax=Rhodococcus sp. TaxID=1831 RepID=UPI003BB6B3E1